MHKSQIVCQGKVDWELVKNEFTRIFYQADTHGIESLTEHEQEVHKELTTIIRYMVLNGLIQKVEITF